MTWSFHQCLQEAQAPAASRLFPSVLVGHKESWLGVGDSSSLHSFALVFSAPKGGAVTFSETADGWSHLIPAICGMTVLGAMLFIIAVLLS